ncbi:hypothetical protein JTB14_033967 [Gonioctena quinquepunctata]|nr:hypothetical protein JTB14_033967 [Gonioctena quinquepunctata]
MAAILAPLSRKAMLPRRCHSLGRIVYAGGYVTRAKANPTLGIKLHTAQKYKHLKQCWTKEKFGVSTTQHSRVESQSFCGFEFGSISVRITARKHSRLLLVADLAGAAEAVADLADVGLSDVADLADLDADVVAELVVAVDASDAEDNNGEQGGQCLQSQ